MQCDMRELLGLQAGSTAAFADRSVAQSAGCLEEAWAWGFDVDVWRAHLGPLTWPEVGLLSLFLWGMSPGGHRMSCACRS
jgi:hypothetical protein